MSCERKKYRVNIVCINLHLGSGYLCRALIHLPRNVIVIVPEVVPSSTCWTEFHIIHAAPWLQSIRSNLARDISIQQEHGIACVYRTQERVFDFEEV